MTDVEKKTAVITGAAGGIGQAISRQFVANGYRVVAGDADQAGLDRLKAELNRTGQTVWSRAGDLRNKAYCEELIDYSIRATGRLDVLVNNAGIITRGNILKMTDEHWERTFDINLTSIFYTCRKAIGHMKGHGGGAIVNVSSCWGLYPGPGHAAYCTSKAAVASFSKCLGRDHAPDGIRVNAVCPNEVNTPMIRTGFERRGFISGHSHCGAQQDRTTWSYRRAGRHRRRCVLSVLRRRPLHRWHGGRSERREAGLLRTSHG